VFAGCDIDLTQFPACGVAGRKNKGYRRMARVVARSLEDLQKEMTGKEDRSKEKERGQVPMSARAVDEMPGYRERVYEIVSRIPAGRVMTYGQIAEMLGEGYTARTVGFVMHSADEETTPWHRVINAQGGCSTGRVIMPPDKQQRMLEAEGVEFNARGRCDLGRYRWIPEEEVEEQRRRDEEDEGQASLFPD
jgi:methylated-DNA-protein-cysteine methyltransferase related protein